MKRNVWAGLLTLAGLLLAVYPARSEDARPPRPHVLLIGISKYKDATIQPRTHAEDDAKALYDLFTNKDYLAIDPSNVKLLLGSEDAKRNSELATRDNIRKAFAWLRTNAGPDDLVVVGFFGQGGPVGDGGQRRCYFASDSTYEDRSKNGVSANEIAEEMDKIKSQRVCLLLDVHFKGVNVKPEPDVSLGDPPYKEFLGDDGSPEHGSLPGRVLYLATNGMTQSIDLKEHGLFAEALLSGLKKDADKDGYEPDGLITTEELATWIDKEMPRLRREFAPDAKRSPHFVIGSQNNRFSLTNNPEARSKAREQLDKLGKLKLSKDLQTEGQNLLERMPRLEGQRKLRMEYQKLVEGKQTADQLQSNRDKLLEAMRLSPEDATTFSEKVLQVVELIEANYVRKVTGGDLVGNAVRGLYRRLDEPIPAEIRDKLEKVKKMTSDEQKTFLTDVRLLLGKREDLDDHKDLDIALARMLAPLDPYTTYVGPADKARFEIDFRADYSGIGAQIRKDEATDMVRIVTPIRSGPAHKLGIQADDLIAKITRDVDSDGKKLASAEVLDTRDMALNEVVKKLLGKPGTKVKLTLQRKGEEKPVEVEVERGRVLMETVMGIRRVEADAWDYWLDKDKKIAYIRLSQFAPAPPGQPDRGTYGDLKTVLEGLLKDGMKSLVLDLRFNPGGVLTGARDIADLFINDETIVSIKGRNGPANDVKGRKQGTLPDFPMVCLVNGGSASASEIVSACLQDNDRAVIVGERSYGKGSVQNVLEFDKGDLKLTIASFYGPKGTNLNKSSTDGKPEDPWGVKPDKGFELILPAGETDSLAEHLHKREVIRKNKQADEKEFKDRQLEMALEHLRKK